MEITREVCQKVIEFLSEAFDDDLNDEYYGTDNYLFQKFAEIAMNEKFKAEIERENRYKQYLELKKEFENAS